MQEQQEEVVPTAVQAETPQEAPTETEAPEGTNTPETPDNAPAEPEEAAKATPEEEAPAENEEPAADEGWYAHENSEVSSIQTIMKDGGMTPDEADAVFAKALETQNIEDVDIALLKEKLGDDKAELLMYKAKEVYAQNVAQVQKTVQLVHNEFGGEENFLVVAEWAKGRKAEDTGFAARIDVLNGMFDAGGVQAELAARELRHMYNSDGSTSTPNPKVEEGTSGTKPAPADYISRADYTKEIAEAYKTNNAAEVGKLQARRRASVKQERS